MCGICGKIYFDRSQAVDGRLLESMAAVLKHRGPDDSGTYVAGHVGLGHQRLSIIDLSAAGHQPMSNEDASIWIVYNGEIYNFEELRRELEVKGHAFKSHTDTEVIIHLYEEHGPACVHKLRGMFAFAIWDAPQQQLFLARDRAGKKPLAYAVADGALLFASEIKALLQDPAVGREVSPEALSHYLTYQYVPGPLTIFRGIHKLPPAHTLVLRGARLDIQPYWKLSYAAKREGTSDEQAEQLRALFTEAVRLRLRSDVPLGAFLSGGIDSSAVVAMMSRLACQPVKTFSIGFEDADYDELKYARMIAERFQTEHTEFVVKPEALRILPKIIWHYDEPFADPSAIPTFYVVQMTRQHVTVALNGDGGDESFAGYERYRADQLAARYLQLPRCVREGIVRRVVNRLPYQDARWSLVRRLKRFVSGASEDPAQRYLTWLCYFTTDMKQQLWSTAFSHKAAAADSVAVMAEAFRQADTASTLEQALFADVMLYLPYDLLAKVDIASMAYGLEARSPFLDHEVMEFAAALPPGLKLRGRQTKYILKRAFADLLPRAVCERRKMGFGVPLHRWLRQELKQPAYDILLDRRTIERGYFRSEAVRQLLDEHIGMRADHSYRLWALLLLELWHRMFIDRRAVLGI